MRLDSFMHVLMVRVGASERFHFDAASEPAKRYEHLAGSDAASRRGPKSTLAPTARRVAYAQIEPH